MAAGRVGAVLLLLQLILLPGTSGAVIDSCAGGSVELADGDVLTCDGMSCQFCEVDCVGASCDVECRSEASCAYVQLDCGAASTCSMKCLGRESCLNARIGRKSVVSASVPAPPPAATMTQECLAERACTASLMACTDGECVQTCNDVDSCYGMRLVVGAGAQHLPAGVVMTCTGVGACAQAAITFQGGAMPTTPVRLTCVGENACGSGFRVDVDADEVPIQSPALDAAFAAISCGMPSCCTPDVYQRCYPTSIPVTLAPSTPLPATSVPQPTAAPPQPTAVPPPPPSAAPSTETPPTPIPVYTFAPSPPEGHWMSGYRLLVSAAPIPPSSVPPPRDLVPEASAMVAETPAPPAADTFFLGLTLAQGLLVIGYCLVVLAAVTYMCIRQKKPPPAKEVLYTPGGAVLSSSPLSTESPTSPQYEGPLRG